jgi:uncharacterized protein
VKKRLAQITAGLFGLCLSVVSFAHGQVKYPDPVGHVNDFANIIDSATERNLETQLRDYQDKTSIEIAVATVSSLEGITVDEYAVELFNKWGVGDRAKDNGILVLVAPNEREMKIEVGYGLEPDLTDLQAGRIIENDMIPYFRSGKMVEGIAAGVAVIISELGNMPFETRLEERRIANEKRQVDEKRRAEEDKAMLAFLVIAFAALLAIGTPIVWIWLSVKKKQKLQAQFKTNSEVISDCQVLIKKAENDGPNVASSLVSLKSISPEEIWRPFSDSINAIPAGVRLARQEADRMIRLQHQSGWKGSLDTYQEIAVLLATVTTLSSWSKRLEEKVEQVKKSKDDSPAFLNTTLSEIEVTQKALEHKDVSNRARQYLDEARNKCAEAKVCINSSGMLNWIFIYQLIATASGLVGKAKSTADSDKRSAEEARRPRPTYKSSSSSYRSSRSGSSGSGGGFGGFGGGRSGGGGARGKW